MEGEERGGRGRERMGNWEMEGQMACNIQRVHYKGMKCFIFTR